MKYYALIFVIFIFNSLFSQDCLIDEWIKEEYFFDSQILSLREITSDTNHKYNDSVMLPKDITDKYLGIISTVYYQHTDLTDSLFNHYSIHVFPDIAYSQVAMILDTTYNWVRTYIQDSIVSGNNKFDSITSLYDFKLKYAWFLTSSTPIVTIESSEVLNLEPLVTAFKQVDGIEHAEPSGIWAGDGDDIDIIFNDNIATVTFSVGWRDCPCGCINRHYWEFSVNDCVSTFNKSYGDQMTIINSLIHHDRLVFPNPMENKVIISNSTGENLNILIYTIRGELIYRQQTKSDVIDLSKLNSGVYILTVIFKNERRTIKIIKL